MRKELKVAVSLLVVSFVVAVVIVYNHKSKSPDTQQIIAIAMEAKRVGEYPDLKSSVTALKKNPNDAAAYRGLASHYASQRDHAKSIANWRKAVEVEPRNDHNRLYLGFSLRNDKQFAQAAEVFRQISPDSEEATSAKKVLDKMKSRGQIP